MIQNEERYNQDIDRDELEKTLRLCARSTPAHATFFHKRDFSVPFSDIHIPMFAALDNPDIKTLLILGPRGFGKTSIAKAYAARNLTFDLFKFVVPMSETEDLAIGQSENLKYSFLYEERYRLLPSLQGETWAKKEWTTKYDSIVMPRGCGQQVRGLNYRSNRPDLILIDDFQDPEKIKKNVDIQLDNWSWFKSDLLLTIPQFTSMNVNYKIIMIATHPGPGSIVDKLEEQGKWTIIKVPACDENLKSTWPEYKTDDDIRAIYQDFDESGLLDDFFREFMCVSLSQKTQRFRKEDFRYFNPTEENLNSRNDLFTAVIIDPARTADEKSCDSAIVGFSLDQQNNVMYIRGVMAGKYLPNEIAAYALDMAVALQAPMIAPEATGNETFVYNMKQAVIDSGLPIDVVPIKARGDKMDRIAGLLPWYRKWRVLHDESQTRGMEMQLKAFPFGKRVDIIDAEAHILTLMNTGDLYLYGKLAEGMRFNQRRQAQQDAFVDNQWEYI